MGEINLPHQFRFEWEFSPMTPLTIPNSRRTSADLYLIGIPAILLFILFFIDEGYYDLRWMREPGNWVVFLVYWVAMVLGEFLVSLLLPRSWSTTRKLCIICGAGIPLGAILILGFLTFVSGYSV